MKAFKHFAPKAIAVLLVMAMLAAMGVGMVSVSAAEITVTSTANYPHPIKADGIDSLAMRFVTKAAFDAYSVNVATYYATDAVASFALYKWDYNYAKTVAGTPVHQATETIKDNSWHKLSIGTSTPAGEYLIVVKGISTSAEVGTIAWMGDMNTNTYACGCVYRQGTLNRNSSGTATGEMNIRLNFTSTVANYFDYVRSHHIEAQIYANPTASDDTTTTDRVSQHYYRLAPTNQVVAQRLKLTAPFSGIKTGIPNWGGKSTVRISAYTWKGNYANTVASTPFASQIFSNLSDHQQCNLSFTAAQPAGEYLFTFENLTPEQPTAIYYVTSNASGGYSYIDGAEMNNDLRMFVQFPGSKPASPFAACTGYDDTTTGNVTLPQQWQPAADSLLNTHKVQPDTWVFTDGLGRESLQYGDSGINAVNNDKTLAMFYWNWHMAHNKANPGKILNIQEFVEKYPESKNFSSLTDTVTLEDGSTFAPWAGGRSYAWNEPIYGHYSTDDEWVLRRHAELLANAGVDTVFTDNTNGVTTWEDGYDFLCQAWTDAQNDGVNSPKVMFYLPMYTSHIDFKQWTNEQLEYLYMDIYQRGKYSNLWYWFEGKPMMVAYNDQLNTSSSKLHKEINSFFTFRKGYSSYDFYLGNYFAEGNRLDLTEVYARTGFWPWASVYPQPEFYKDYTAITNKDVEQMSVSVAQNYNYKDKTMTAMNGYYVTGRSYTSTNPGRYTNTETNFTTKSDSTKWGYNIGEQYSYALQMDPKVVFVTGWNEWTVVPGMVFKISGVNLADQFNDEYSRDIEPTKGALKDHYYYQLVNFSRQYQGANPMPRPNGEKAIDLNQGLESQWEGVQPYFGAYIGNTMDRDEYGHVTSFYYTDFSGRNDIIGAQVSRDENYLYFNVECNENITPYTDNLWMNLYIDVDQSNKGWETFDYVVNKTAPNATTAVLERFTNGYSSEAVARVEYVVDGKFMTVKIPKSALGISGTDYTVNFAWTDNVHDADDTGATKANGEVIYSEFSGDIMDFYTSGDVAPGARFKYSYIVDDEYKLYEGSEIGDTAVSFDANTYGQRFTIDAGQEMDSLSVQFSAPVYEGAVQGTGTGTLRIYQWKGSYSATVASAALYTEKFTGNNMSWKTFTIPEALELNGQLYWEIDPDNGVKLVPLGATHKAADVVHVINGVDNAACTGNNGSVAMAAKIKYSKIDATYTYYSSLDKTLLYSGNVPFISLTPAEQAAIVDNANKYADATGFRGFTGFELAASEDGVNVYYSVHTYADTIKVDGVDTPLEDGNVVVEAEETNRNGEKFYGWMDKYGNILSNYLSYKFYPSSKDDTIVAVYGVDGSLEMGAHVYTNRVDGQLTVTVTPVRNTTDTVVEFGYFVSAGKTLESLGTVAGGALASIDGASKVVAKDPTVAYLQRTYSLTYASFYQDVAVMAYITYTDGTGNTYTTYEEVVIAEYVVGDSDVEVTDPDQSNGGWL